MPDIEIRTNRGTIDMSPLMGKEGRQGPTGPGADVTGAEIEAARDEAQAAKAAAEQEATRAEAAVGDAEAAAAQAATFGTTPQRVRRYGTLATRPADAFPPTLTIPPAVAFSSNANAVATRKVWALGLSPAPMRYHGGVGVVAATASGSPITATVDSTAYPCYASAPLYDGGPTTASTWTFYSDAPLLVVFGSFHSGSPIYLEVDGRSLPGGALTPTGSFLSIGWNGARRMRRYSLYAFDGFRPAGVVTTPIDSVFATPAVRPLLGVMGDSFMGGSSVQGYRPHALPYLLGHGLGVDLRLDQVGGTGYAKVDGKANFRTRLERNFLTTPLSAMLWAGGINDDAAGLEAAARGCFETFAAAHPDTPQIVLGPWSPSTTYETANAAKWTAVQNAAAAVPGCTYIDTRGWVTGTGKDGAPTGDGNADVITSTDGTHPTFPAVNPTNGIGTVYLATRATAAISQRIAEGTIR